VAIEKFAIEKNGGALKRLLVQRCGVPAPEAALRARSIIATTVVAASASADAAAQLQIKRP
jgi:hypothetical protein